MITIREIYDGACEGVIRQEKPQSNFLTFRIPKEKIRDQFVEGHSLNTQGVYILLGVSTESGLEYIYIGEGHLSTRLPTHKNNDKKKFTHAIVVMKREGAFDKTTIKYIESQWIKKAKKSGRYEMINGVDPVEHPIDSYLKSIVEAWMEDVEPLVFDLAGKNLFVSLPTTIQKEETVIVEEVSVVKNETNHTVDGLVFVCKDSFCDATGKFIDKKHFYVFKGSKFRLIAPPNFSKHCPRQKKLQDEMIESGILKSDGKHYVLQSDYTFSSCHQAAMSVCSCSANGLTNWFYDNKPLRDYIK